MVGRRRCRRGCANWSSGRKQCWKNCRSCSRACSRWRSSTASTLQQLLLSLLVLQQQRLCQDRHHSRYGNRLTEVSDRFISSNFLQHCWAVTALLLVDFLQHCWSSFPAHWSCKQDPVFLIAVANYSCFSLKLDLISLWTVQRKRRLWGWVMNRKESSPIEKSFLLICHGIKNLDRTCHSLSDARENDVLLVTQVQGRELNMRGSQASFFLGGGGGRAIHFTWER